MCATPSTALWQTPAWAGRAALWDFREAEFDLSPDDVRAIAHHVVTSQPRAPARVAFVAPREVDFGMARMFEAYREHPATAFHVFRDYEEALHWARSSEPDPA